MPVDLFLTHYRIDSFRVLRQSFCGKFEFSAEFSSKLFQFFGCMGEDHNPSEDSMFCSVHFTSFVQQKKPVCTNLENGVKKMKKVKFL